jgi:hypothetical protein
MGYKIRLNGSNVSDNARVKMTTSVVNEQVQLEAQSSPILGAR